MFRSFLFSLGCFLLLSASAWAADKEAEKPAAAAEAAAVTPVPADAAVTPRRRATSRVHLDARRCLRFPDNARVRACAEKYR